MASLLQTEIGLAQLVFLLPGIRGVDQEILNVEQFLGQPIPQDELERPGELIELGEKPLDDVVTLGDRFNFRHGDVLPERNLQRALALLGQEKKCKSVKVQSLIRPGAAKTEDVVTDTNGAPVAIARAQPRRVVVPTPAAIHTQGTITR